MQLMNHAKSLNFLGAKWVSQFLLREQQYTIDLLNDNGADSSFIERWQNSSELAHSLYSSEFHRIISKTMIVKFNQYLVGNQIFKKDKSGRQISNSIMPIEDDLDTWSKGWLVSVNVKELSYQLCTMSFRTRSGENFSQQHRNTLNFGELFKVFDWGMYAKEQKQIRNVSIAEQSLNKKHQQQCKELCQAKITLNDDGTTGILTSQ